jgi:DegV family protein with EDD domain
MYQAKGDCDMPKVAIITDSTCYLPTEYVKKYNISVAPQVLIWGEETFQDGVDIQPVEYYKRLKNAKIMPSTSQVIPKTFVDMYQKLLKQEYQVLCILISNVLSGTIASAIQAIDLVRGAKDHVAIVDSYATSMAMGFQVLETAKLAATGASLDECKIFAEKTRDHTGVVFAVETLEFLHRGGRIGGASRFLGTALNIKPILELREGKVEPIERVRTRTKSLERLIELIEDRIGGRTPVRIAALHANSEEDARYVLNQATQRIKTVEAILADVSPVVGTHAGPGTVGLAFMAGM